MSFASFMVRGLDRIVGRVEVRGPSMEPTLVAGERLLLWRSRRVHIGDVVVVRDPLAPDRYLVKRVIAIRSDGIELAGDNAGASRDSRDFGVVAKEDLIGRAWYRYFPASARGRIDVGAQKDAQNRH
jgi:nickel-type superoxide dismutase maturation protease